MIFTNIINLETGIQTAVVIEDSAATPDFVDDNSVAPAEICSANIESRTDSAVHGTVPSEEAYIISIGYNKVFTVR